MGESAEHRTCGLDCCACFGRGGSFFFSFLFNSSLSFRVVLLLLVFGGCHLFGVGFTSWL